MRLYQKKEAPAEPGLDCEKAASAAPSKKAF
jgi:hypothetical protein